jgi:hypothetical protein
MSPENAFREALTEILKANAPIAALIEHRVYDRVPSKNAPERDSPYLYMGPMGRTRIPLDCYQAWTVRARIYAVSTKFQRTQVWDLAELVVQALDLLDAPDLVLPPPLSLQEPLKITQAGDVVDPLAPQSVFVDVSTTIARAA